MKSNLIRRFTCSKACTIIECCRPGFFAPLRMTYDGWRRAQGAGRRANFLSQISGLSPSEGGRGRRLDCVVLFAIFISIAVLISPNAFSQDSMQNMPGMTGTAKPKEAQPKAQQEQAVPEVPKVEISPDQQKLIGVKIVKASMNPLTKVIRTVGRVETNEKNIATINAKIEGWVEKLYVDYTGRYVKKGEPLAEIYSPELLATQKEFINTLKWTKGQGNAVKVPDAGYAEGDSSARSIDPVSNLSEMLQKDALDTQDAAKQRLRLWDMSEAQIAQVEETGRPIRTITLYSPVSGFVTEKMAVLGMKVMPGEKLFDMADLSNIWIIADIYQNELPFVKVGQAARITLSYMPGKELSSKIDYIYPIVSEDTRTTKIRLSLANPGGQLKPQMYTNVEISVDLGKKLTIPDSAVIDTGVQQVVYVDLGDGTFEPREVQIGLRSGGYAEVLKGLKEGEGVSSSANFLIDSEAQIKGIKPLSGK